MFSVITDIPSAISTLKTPPKSLGSCCYCKKKALECVNQCLIMAKPNVSTIGLAATTEMSGFELNILVGFIWHV